MKPDLDSVLNAILQLEGGYADSPYDHGGKTMFGITQAVAKQHGINDITKITEDQAKKIYAEYIPEHFRNLPPSFLLMFGHFAILAGTTTAITVLQRALGINADGKTTPQGQTHRAILQYCANLEGKRELYARMTRKQIQYLDAVAKKPGQATFQVGWQMRVYRALFTAGIFAGKE